MNKRILKAIIANAVDHIHGSVQPGERSTDALIEELGLTKEQAQTAILVTGEVAEAKDWLFSDDSDEYNYEIVRKFVHRKCVDKFTLMPLHGEALSDFIAELHKLIK